MTQRTSSFLALLLITLPIARAAAQQSPWRKLPLPGGGNVEVFAGEGEHLYVKTGDVIHRSTDGGETWSAGGAIDTWVNVMRLDRAGNIYAGTSGSLHRSTDQGSTWAHLPWSAGDVWDVAFNSNGGIFVATETSFVQYSTDNGATWKIVGAAEMGPVWSIAVDADDRVLAGCQGEGFFSSTNNGGLWRWGLKGRIIYAITAAPDGTIFAGTDDEGVFRSTDHGLSFVKTPLQRQSGFEKLTIGRTMVIGPGGDLFVYGMAFAPGGAVYRVFRSADNGDHWEPFDDGLGLASGDYIVGMYMDGSGTLFVAARSGIYSRAGSIASVGGEKGATGELRLATGNPVRGRALFMLGESAPRNATLDIVDAAGRGVARLGVDGTGSRAIAWDASDVPPGVYLCRLVGEGDGEVLKVVVAP